MHTKQIRHTRATLLLTFLVFVSQSQLFGEDPNVEIMKKLFAKIGQVVGVGSNDIVVGTSFLVLANPGIMVDPSLDMSKLEDRHTLAVSIDKVLLPTWIYGVTNETVLSVYQNVLTYKEPPVYVMTPQEKKMLADARAIIFKDVNRRIYSDAFKQYQDTRRQLSVALGAVETYRRANPAQSIPAPLLNDVQVAREAYNLIGDRNKMIGAKATIDTYEALDPQVWWGNLQQQFNDSTELYNNQPSGLYDLFPRYQNWLDKSATWAPFTVTEKQLEQTTSSSQTSVGGGLSVNYGLWSVAGDYNHLEKRTYFQLDVSGYSISMELLRVTLDRPWMASTVFHSRAWKWLDSTPYGPESLISDGGDAVHGVTPHGIMPFLPTGLLLAKNVSITGSWSNDLKTTYESQTSGGGSIGWGPFSVGGRTNSSEASTYTKAKAAGNTITFTSPQIIGFFAEVLPKSPNRDPKLKFPSDNPNSMLKFTIQMKVHESDILMQRSGIVISAEQKNEKGKQ
jgi:hypothetical protein